MQQLEYPIPDALPWQVMVELDGFRDLVLHREDRVERSHRVLQDHGDLLAAVAAHGIRRFHREALAGERDLPADDA